MASKLRWGILSTSRITEALVFALREAPRSELAAVASREGDKAREFSEREGIPTWYGSYEELLADRSIDVVYVPLPNRLHAEWAVKAAGAGKHVLVEKPIVTTLQDMAAVEAAARDNNVVIFEAFMSLHAPQNRQVIEMVRSGHIGELRLINSWFCFNLPREQSGNIRLNQQLHGGSFWDVGVYPNSLSIVLAGGRAPRRVWATADTGETGVDVVMAAQMQFEGGTVAQMYSSFRSPRAEGAQITGSTGIIRLTTTWIPGMSTRSKHGSGTTIEITGLDGTTQVVEVPASNPWQKEVEAMEACVLDGAQPVVPLSMSREFLKSALAVHESARTGRAVEL